MKKLIAAVAMMALATPAFAAIQNVKVSGDITATFLDRNTFDLGETNLENGTTGGADFAPAGLKKQNVFITQTRLRVDADLSDNVSATVGLINERAWGSEYTSGPNTSIPNAVSNTDSLDTNVQLYLASVTMREFLYSPLTITVGRQVFSYGNGLVLGDGGPNNSATGNLQYIAADLTERTSYDGIKAVLDYKPLTIDMFYFKNAQTLFNGNPNSGSSSSDVFGVNANYQLSDPMGTVVEGYMFSRLSGNQLGTYSASNTTGTVTAISPNDKGNTLFVPGLHVSTNPVKGLNVQGEVAWQLGQATITDGVNGVNQQESEKRDAMAAQVLASYSLPVLDKYKPTVNASYTYVSGDDDGSRNYDATPYSSAKTLTAWDPFNEAQGSGTIYNSMFVLSNMHIVSAGASFNPLEDVTAAFTWSGLWSAVPYGATNQLVLIQPDGSSNLTPQTKSKRTSLGNEYDVNLTYNYTEDVTFGVSLGWFVPGSVFSNNNNNVAQQALADVNVKF